MIIIIWCKILLYQLVWQLHASCSWWCGEGHGKVWLLHSPSLEFSLCCLTSLVKDTSSNLGSLLVGVTAHMCTAYGDNNRSRGCTDVLILIPGGHAGRNFYYWQTHICIICVSGQSRPRCFCRQWTTWLLPGRLRRLCGLLITLHEMWDLSVTAL